MHSVIVLDGEGQRIASRYYMGDMPTLKEQKAFEASLHAKTRGANAEIVMLGTRGTSLLVEGGFFWALSLGFAFFAFGGYTLAEAKIWVLFCCGCFGVFPPFFFLLFCVSMSH